MLATTGIAAAFAVLALGTTFLAVQVGGPDEEAERAAAPMGEAWVVVTGTQVLTGSTADCAVAGWHPNVSDPRLKGNLCINYETDGGGEDLATYWSSITITNDEGSWHGHSVGFMDEQGAHRHMGWFEGHDAYEGLAFIEQLTESNPEDPSAGGQLDVVGLIYEGELPPMVIPDWTAGPAEEAE